MKPDDYIRGARHGREAHDLELSAMSDPLLAEALDGFDAVPGAPGEHSAALERLAGGIARSASEGKAAARSRAARLRERRVRGWSIAAAAVFLAAVAGSGTWLLRNGVRTDSSSTLASRTGSGGFRDEVVEILPPVTVITEEEEAREIAAEPTPLPPPTEMSEMRLDSSELPMMAEINSVVADAEMVPEIVVEAVPDVAVDAVIVSTPVAEVGRDVIAETVVMPEVVAETLAVRSQSAARMAEMSGIAQAEVQTKIQTGTPARDTTQTVGFRRHVADRNRMRSAVMGPVTISFEVGADGRPVGVQIVESPTPELGEFARTLLDEGPDWPVEPSQKLITINL